MPESSKKKATKLTKKAKKADSSAKKRMEAILSPQFGLENVFSQTFSAKMHENGLEANTRLSQMLA